MTDLAQLRALAFLLKVSNGAVPPLFATVAGLRVEQETRQPGVISLTGRGVFTGSNAESRIKSAALSGQIDEYQVQFENGETITGRFLITRLDYAGDYSGERNYRMTLEQVKP